MAHVAKDQVFLEGMVFYGFHGVHAEERHLGQRFIVDMEAVCDLEPAARADDLNQTISYSDLYQVTREIVEGEPRQLIESVAVEIATAVLSRFNVVEQVTVTVRKPGAPVKGSVLDNVGVRVQRQR